MSNQERWQIFIEELRAYIMEYHLGFGVIDSVTEDRLVSEGFMLPACPESAEGTVSEGFSLVA